MPNDVEERGYEENSQIFTSRRLFQYFDRLSDTVAVCNAHGTIQFVNDEWWRFASNNGYEGPDFIGQNYFSLCTNVEGAERHHAEDVMRGLLQLRSGELGTFSYVYPCHVPAEERWFKIVATFDRNEFYLHHQRVVLRFEEAGVVTQAAERDALVRRDTQIAHDIRTYVNGVLGYLQVARQKLELERNVEDCSLLLAEAEHVGWRVHNAIRALVEDGDVPFDDLDPDTYSADIGEAVRSALRAIKKKHPGVSTDIDVSVPNTCRVLARAIDVDRIVFDVFRHAFVRTPEGGTVSATVRQNRSGGIELVVRDSNDAQRPATVPVNAEIDGLIRELGAWAGSDVTEQGAHTVTVAFPAWRTLELEAG